MSLFIDNAIAGWIRNAEQTGELKNNAYHGKKIDLDEYFQDTGRTPYVDEDLKRCQLLATSR